MRITIELDMAAKTVTVDGKPVGTEGVVEPLAPQAQSLATDAGPSAELVPPPSGGTSGAQTLAASQDALPTTDAGQAPSSATGDASSTGSSVAQGDLGATTAGPTPPSVRDTFGSIFENRQNR